MEAFKIVSVGIICAVAVVIVRQYRPEYSSFVQIGGIIVIAAMVFKELKKVMSDAAGIFASADVIEDGYLELMIKVLGVAIITKIGVDICIDSGNNALATNVELAGKVLILMMCMSLLKAVASLAGGLLG